ncbi:MAG TPA: hypothetical protein VLE48_11230 [Terriglobales bacterium]|nr:hypothetical protein [Terriglobales bacterium]
MHFVIVDLDLKRSDAQQELVRKHYRGYIPHLTLYDRNGKVLYDQSGERSEEAISAILDKALQ